MRTRRVALAAALPALLLAAPAAAPARPLEQKIEEANADLKARYQQLLEATERLQQKVDRHAHEALEWGQELASTMMKGLKGKFQQLGDETKSQYGKIQQAIQKIYGKYTDRTVVVGLLKVEGTSMHAIAKHGFLKGLWNAAKGDLPYLPFPVYMELRPGDAGVARLHKDMAYGVVEAMDYTGTDEVPAWIGFHIAKGKIWGRPVLTTPTEDEVALLEPLLGPHLARGGQS